MKRAFCKKPCTIGGRAFVIGDEIPMEIIAPDRQTTLIQYGLIAVEDMPEAEHSAVGDPESGKGRSGKRVKA